MSTQPPTIADPTRIGTTPNQVAKLMVYIESNDGPVSQLVQLPEGVEVTVGRSRQCTVTVDSERISRRHLRIIRVGTVVTVEDLGSRNGTRVNGELITAVCPLNPGDEVTARPISIALTTTGAVRWRRRILDSPAFAARLRAEIDRGTRYKRTFVLAMLRLDGEADVIDRAIENLSGRVRAMDVLGDYGANEGANELALILPELNVDSGSVALERLVEVVSQPSLTVRAALATFPTHGSQAGALIDAARSVLRTARKSGQRMLSCPTSPPHAAGDAIAEAPATRALFSLIEKVASSPMTVLVIGETGAGKEIAAHTIHRRSRRQSGPFIVLNCACLPSTLLESELFGHEKGAFTGADERKIGFFEAATGGTLFLDEIGEIEAGLQAKLLRVLEARKVIRVGGTRELPVDVRVVCATNRDLSEEVNAGRFRADLFYRISGFTIVVPPLRERTADILPLATRFIAEVAADLQIEPAVLAPRARDALLSYAWPGNIRELRNALERASVLASNRIIELADLPEAVASTRVATTMTPAGDNMNKLDVVEREAIAAALEATGGNQTQAARNLGLTRRALIYRMEKHGLKPKPKG